MKSKMLLRIFRADEVAGNGEISYNEKTKSGTERGGFPVAVMKMSVKDIEKYWERLSGKLSIFLRCLQERAEYGSSVSERGVQQSAVYTAERMARDRGMNVNLVSSLCQAVAICFPARGFAELAVIKEYIKKNRMDTPLDTLEIDAIEHAIHCSGVPVTPELDALLHKYYFGDESVPEVNLVRFLQKYLNLHRELLRECPYANCGQVVNTIMKRAECEYETSYRLLPDPVVLPVPQHVKEEIETNIAAFIKYQSAAGTGIYEAII